MFGAKTELYFESYRFFFSPPINEDGWRMLTSGDAVASHRHGNWVFFFFVQLTVGCSSG